MGKLEELIKLHEGFSRYPYECTAGKTTIGWGRNLSSNGITESEAKTLLRNDIDAAWREVVRSFPHFNDLDEVRQAVVIDMCFNLGWPTLSKFSRFLHALSQDNYSQAAIEMMDSRWYRQVGQRAERLVEMMLTGEWAKDLD